MLKSSLHLQQPQGLHVAIIMDGNGRWAAMRGRPRTLGHRAGARQVRQIVEAAPNLGIGTLTLYAFSSDNWQRPPHEVTSLMRLFQVYLRAEIDTCLRNGVRLNIIGRRDRLPQALITSIDAAETATSDGRLLHLRIALDYSARDAILKAAQGLVAVEELSLDAFAGLLGEADNGGGALDVDLLIRTGGEQRLSDFLLWECAYAELYFTRLMWPEFTPADLAAAVQDFHARERRFGRIPTALSV